MLNSRKIEDLDPEVRLVCLRHMALCHAEGIELLITSTYRDYEEQDALYAQGRTKPGPRVTDAPAGHSWHNLKLAWDAVPLIHGKADWNIDDPPFKRMVELGRQAGAECGYDWVEFKDSDHFQVRPKSSSGELITIDEAKLKFDKTGSCFLDA